LAEGDNQRVESRLAGIGRGFSSTPERIETLRKQAEKLERTRQGPPAKAFGAVLGAKRGEPKEEPVESEDEEKVLPRGPRPALSHPKQQERFGRSKSKGNVILKG